MDTSPTWWSIEQIIYSSISWLTIRFIALPTDGTSRSSSPILTRLCCWPRIANTLYYPFSIGRPIHLTDHRAYLGESQKSQFTWSSDSRKDFGCSYFTCFHSVIVIFIITITITVTLTHATAAYGFLILNPPLLLTNIVSMTTVISPDIILADRVCWNSGVMLSWRPLRSSVWPISRL